MPLVSVIIPTYGQPDYLDSAIKSVCSQTFTDWELLIVDDNNPDTQARKETEILMTQFENESRIKYLKHPYNKNGAAARNTGIRVASGKYIAFLDSDDEYREDRLLKCVNAIENCADILVGGVYSGCSFYRGGKKYSEMLDIKSGNFLIDTLACIFPFCSGSNIFIKRAIINELNGFDETFIRHQDYEFLVRFFEKYSLIAINEPLIKKNNECFNVPNTSKLVEVKKHYLDKFSYLIDGFPEEDKRKIYRSHYYAILQSAVQSNSKSIFKEYKNKLSLLEKLTLKENVRLFLLRIRSLMQNRGK